MTTHIAIDDALINEALTLGHFETKEDTVITALREFINHRKQQEIIQLFGTLDSDLDNEKHNTVILGVLEDAFSIPDNFDEHLSEDIINEFYTDKL